MIESILILSSLAMFIVSNLFWLYHYNKLLNKFMCRNYHEFVTAEVLREETLKESEPKDEAVLDPYEAQRIRELNQLTGMV